MQKEICHLCHENKPLTREHIPPFASGNNKGYLNRIMYDPKEGFSSQELTPNPDRLGYSFRHLCRECNNKLTSNYANEYTKVSESIESQYSNNVDSNMEVFSFEVTFTPYYFMKYIICSMLCIQPIEFGKLHPEFREYVLNDNIPCSAIGN